MKYLKTFEGSYDETTKKYNVGDYVMYKELTASDNWSQYKKFKYTAAIGKVISINWQGDLYVEKLLPNSLLGDGIEARLGPNDILRKVEDWEIEAKKYNL